MQITKDHEKIVSIIENPKNEKEHVNAIMKCIMLFNQKWYREAITNELILMFSQYTLDHDSRFENLKHKIYGDNKAEL